MRYGKAISRTSLIRIASISRMNIYRSRPVDSAPKDASIREKSKLSFCNLPYTLINGGSPVYFMRILEKGAKVTRWSQAQ